MPPVRALRPLTNGPAMHVQHQGGECLIKTDPGSGQTYYDHWDSQWHALAGAQP